MEKTKYLTTGGFAKLCGTTKETLFHYDRVGLLKPKYVSANGYRRYQAEQFFEFDLIRVLKGAGSSLEDIGGYLSSYDVDHLLPILDAKVAALKERQKDLGRRIEGLIRISRVTRSALTGNYGLMTIEYRAEEKLLAESFDSEERGEMSWDETAFYLSRHLRRCREVGLSRIFPIGYMAPLGSIGRGSCVEGRFFSAVDEDLAIEGLLVKPAGEYACFLHRGSYDGLMAALPGYLATISEGGWATEGWVYIYALLSYLASRAEENDVHRIMVKVEKKG